MFKLGLITDEASQELEEAAQLAVKYGVKGLEIRSVWDKGPHELDDEDIARIKAVLEKYDLECCGISSPFLKCELDDEEEVAANMEILKKCIHLAKALGTKYIRGFTGWKRKSLDEVLPLIVERYQPVIELMEKEDLYILIEFDPSVYATNGEQVAKVLKAINHDRVKALWDPGNDIADPDGEVPYPDGYEFIKDYFVHVHLKDCVRHPDGIFEGVPLCKGQVDYVNQFKRLVADNYNGYVVLETHYRPKHEISEDLLKLPKGASFSLYGYEASEECLINLKALFKELNIDA